VTAADHEGGPKAAFLFVLCLVLLGIFACPCALSARDLQPVRIGLTRSAAAAPLLIAVEAGYFEEQGLEPQLIYFDTDAEVAIGAASGHIDVGMSALSAAYYRYAAIHALKIIASRSSDQTGFPMYALLVSKRAHAAGFAGVAALVDARIGVEGTGSGAFYALFDVGSRFKLEPSSIKTVSFKSSAIELAALARGDIDAALLPYPVALKFLSGGRWLLRLSDFAQWQEGVAFSAANDIDAKRELIARFMRAYQRGTADYQLNFLSYDDGGDFIPGPNYDKYLDIVARRMRMSDDLLAKTKSYCDRRANLDVADIERQVQFWQAHGALDKSVAAADFLDLSFIGEESAAKGSSD
jgi:NitT/TauT family transport system substrate-binding protein